MTIRFCDLGNANFLRSLLIDQRLSSAMSEIESLSQTWSECYDVERPRIKDYCLALKFLKLLEEFLKKHWSDFNTEGKLELLGLALRLKDKNRNEDETTTKGLMVRMGNLLSFRFAILFVRSWLSLFRAGQVELIEPILAQTRLCLDLVVEQAKNDWSPLEKNWTK